MVPIVTRLASDFDGRALVATVDVTVHTDLSRAQSVRVVPTFVFFKDGREVSRQEGTTTYQDLASKLQALLESR